uniref:Glutathione S-Transferase-Epsilon6 n=1 Tax=Plutella xylostella TaxID=51655 RepID=A0A1L8D6F5_PLUXY
MKLYKLDGSPPARSAMMAVEALGLAVDAVDCDLLKGENTSPEYMKKNPVHTIPLLEDGDLTIHDSHVIVTYLVDKYAKDDSLYPKDIKKRAQVDQKLYFDATILFPRLRAVTYPMIAEGLTKPTEKMLSQIEEAYSMLDAFLSGSKWLAGDSMTVADICAVGSVTGLNHIVRLDTAKYPNVAAWLNTMKQQPFVKSKNEPGDTFLGQWIASKLTSS